MAFVSQLTGKTVTDLEGRKVGSVKDIVARFLGDLRHPIVEGLLVKRKNDEVIVPYADVVALLSPAIPIRCREDQLQPYSSAREDILLSRDVLDRQIIDTEGMRVVRVNDLELVRVNGNMVVSNVDVSALGLLRRLGFERPVRKVAGLVGRRPHGVFISWDDVELAPDEPAMRLRVSRNALAELHPAEIVDILTELNHTQGEDLLEALDLPQLADTLEEVDANISAGLVEAMTDEKVADLLEEMEPDDAADLLAELPEERSAGLLELMEHDDAAEMRRLMAYPVDSAGGLMNTRFAAIPTGLTTGEAIDLLRQTAGEVEVMNYIYIIAPGGRLQGVTALSRLILAPPFTRVESIMHRRVVAIGLDAAQDVIAQMVAKYDLLAVPVVDAKGLMHGIVTAEDALDRIIPTAWKKRLPRFYR
jgi:sporulation protein YlmC with PRC-barrel domain